MSVISAAQATQIAYDANFDSLVAKVDTGIRANARDGYNTCTVKVDEHLEEVIQRVVKIVKGAGYTVAFEQFVSGPRRMIISWPVGHAQ